METCKGSCALHKQDINAGALFLKKTIFRKKKQTVLQSIVSQEQKEGTSVYQAPLEHFPGCTDASILF